MRSSLILIKISIIISIQSIVYCAPRTTTIPDLVDESQVIGLEGFLTQLEPDLRQLVISILTIYERSQKDLIQDRLRDLMQQQPYELLDRLLEVYKKARRKEFIYKKDVSSTEQEMINRYVADK